MCDSGGDAAIPADLPLPLPLPGPTAPLARRRPLRPRSPGGLGAGVRRCHTILAFFGRLPMVDDRGGVVTSRAHYAPSRPLHVGWGLPGLREGNRE